MMHKEQDKNRELSDRITADLRRKAQENSATTDLDLAEDTDYVKDLKKTSRFGWVWIVLIVLAVLSLLLIFRP